MQLFRGGLGLRPALHIQLGEDVAHMGLHGRQLHIHDLRDLGVGLVGAEQMENLQLRGRQLLTGGKALVMEKAGRVTSLLVRSRNTAGMMVVSPSAPLCGKEMSSHASLPLACLPAASCFSQCFTYCFRLFLHIFYSQYIIH